MRRNLWNTGTALLACAFLAASPVSAAGLDIFGNIGSEVDMIAGFMDQAYPESVIAMDDIGISVDVDEYDYTAIRQTDGFVYIYTMDDGSMPYIIAGKYDTVTNGFADAFTAYMAKNYKDLDVVYLDETVRLGGKSFTEIAYEYTVSGYTVFDTRLFCTWNNRTYMFGTKEVPEIGFEVEEGFLDQVAGSFAQLAGGDSDYAKHVDSRRSVEKTAEDLTGLSEDAFKDVLESGNNEAEASVGEDVGSIGSETEDAPNSYVFDERTAGYEGTWVQFQDGFRIYLPDDWSVFSLTDEQKNANILYYAGDDSGTENAPYVLVNWIESNGISTIDELAEAIEASGYTVDEKVLLNGIESVTYMSESLDTVGVMFFHPYSKDYLFAFVTGEYGSNVELQTMVLSSLSPIE